MSALFPKQYCGSPVRDCSFDLYAIRKAFFTMLGKTSDPWYQSLQKLLILLLDSWEQCCSADTMFPWLNMTPKFPAPNDGLQKALAYLKSNSSLLIKGFLITFLIRCRQQFHFFLRFLQDGGVKFEDLMKKTAVKLQGARMGTQLFWSLKVQRGEMQIVSYRQRFTSKRI